VNERIAILTFSLCGRTLAQLSGYGWLILFYGCADLAGCYSISKCAQGIYCFNAESNNELLGLNIGLDKAANDCSENCKSINIAVADRVSTRESVSVLLTLNLTSVMMT